MGTGEGGIEAGVIAHGSRITAEDVQAINRPVLFLFSDNDKQIPTELREKFEGILHEKKQSFPAEGKFYPAMVSIAPPLYQPGALRQTFMLACLGSAITLSCMLQFPCSHASALAHVTLGNCRRTC